MAKHVSAYQSSKRKKELLRKKKQEDKRIKRLNKNTDVQQDTETTESTAASKE
ncbi:MAG: hypothetical protein AB1610_06500 [Nitrospirota bacterium]